MFIEVNGIRFNTVSFGTGEQTFLALCGFVANWELWQQTFDLLSKRWRCIGYDQRGIGSSPAPTKSITREAVVDDVFAVMDALKIKRCILCGVSSGGAIAIMAALRQPDRFKGLVLVSSINPNPKPLTDAEKQLIAGLHTHYQATIKNFMNLAIPEPNSEHIRRWGLEIFLRSKPEAAIRWLEIFSEGEVDFKLSDITVPTLVIHGSKDVIVPLKNSEYLASVIPGAELVVIEGAGHGPMATRPHDVVDAIKRRFSQLE